MHVKSNDRSVLGDENFVYRTGWHSYNASVRETAGMGLKCNSGIKEDV